MGERLAISIVPRYVISSSCLVLGDAVAAVGVKLGCAVGVAEASDGAVEGVSV
jgi:hypothetical protein